MWVRTDEESSTLNHIVPLVTKSRRCFAYTMPILAMYILVFCIGKDTTVVTAPEERTKFVSETIQYGLCPLCAFTGGTDKNSDMVQCDTC